MIESPKNLREQLLNLTERIATEMRAIHSKAKTALYSVNGIKPDVNGNVVIEKVAKADADGNGNEISTTYAKISSLKAVALSGSYADVSNKPRLNGATLEFGSNQINTLYGDDNRSDATVPSAYQRSGGMFAHGGMRSATTLGVPGVGSLGAVLEISSCGDNSGGAVHELGFFNGTIHLRTSKDSSTWNDWKKISVIPTGGTSSQFVKADGTLDSTKYLVKDDLSDFLSKSEVNTIDYTGGAFLKRKDDTGWYAILGGNNSNNGSSLVLNGGNTGDADAGNFELRAKSNAGAQHVLYGYADGSLTWSGKNVVRSINGILADKAGNVVVPHVTKTSELTNDANFLVPSSLDNYYNKQDVDNKVSTIPKFSIQVVSSLPTSGISETTVYLVKSGDDSSNIYTEYIYVGGKWERLGTQDVDLSGYALKTEFSKYLPLTGGTVTGTTKVADITFSSERLESVTGTMTFCSNSNNPFWGFTYGSGKWYVQMHNNQLAVGAGINSSWKIDASGNTTQPGNATAKSFVRTDGTASQFLKADGSVDSTTYATKTYADSTFATKAYTDSTFTTKKYVDDAISKVGVLVNRVRTTLVANLAAGSDFSVPAHTVGTNAMQVFVDGLLCMAGANYQYIDKSATAITFNDELRAGTDIDIVLISTGDVTESLAKSVQDSIASFATTMNSKASTADVATLSAKVDTKLDAETYNTEKQDAYDSLS